MRMTSLLHTIALSTALSTSIVSVLPGAFAEEATSRAMNASPRGEAPTLADLQKQLAQRRPGMAPGQATIPAPSVLYQFDAPKNSAGQRIDDAGIPLLEDRSLDGG